VGGEEGRLRQVGKLRRVRFKRAGIMLRSPRWGQTVLGSPKNEALPRESSVLRGATREGMAFMRGAPSLGTRPIRDFRASFASCFFIQVTVANGFHERMSLSGHVLAGGGRAAVRNGSGRCEGYAPLLADHSPWDLGRDDLRGPWFARCL